MKRTPIATYPSDMPPELAALCRGAELYDSSCSPQARVIYIDRDGGYFLKVSDKGTLRAEAEMDRYFYKKGLGAQVLCYDSLERDWLLTRRVAGEDATHTRYLSEPERLARTLGRLLRELHSRDIADCPVSDKMNDYFALVDKNYRDGAYDLSYCGLASADEAYAVARDGRELLSGDTLIHGDYCLPNIIFDDWRFSGFIDLGLGGVGDRHIDLFWGAWTLRFNLGTDKYRDIFFDAYGRENINEDALRVVAAAETFG